MDTESNLVSKRPMQGVRVERCATPLTMTDIAIASYVTSIRKAMFPQHPSKLALRMAQSWQGWSDYGLPVRVVLYLTEHSPDQPLRSTTSY